MNNPYKENDQTPLPRVGSYFYSTGKSRIGSVYSNHLYPGEKTGLTLRGRTLHGNEHIEANVVPNFPTAYYGWGDGGPRVLSVPVRDETDSFGREFKVVDGELVFVDYRHRSIPGKFWIPKKED